jgi:hypothetical protein
MIFFYNFVSENQIIAHRMCNFTLSQFGKIAKLLIVFAICLNASNITFAQLAQAIVIIR